MLGNEVYLASFPLRRGRLTCKKPSERHVADVGQARVRHGRDARRLPCLSPIMPYCGRVLLFLLATCCSHVAFGDVANGLDTMEYAPGWQSWGASSYQVGAKCPRPFSPPESQLVITAVGDELALRFSCMGNHHLVGPEYLYCNETSSLWTRRNASVWDKQMPVCAVCPTGWFGLQGNCYALVAGRLATWFIARNVCRSANTSLAEITDTVTQNFISAVIGDRDLAQSLVRNHAFKEQKRRISVRDVWIGLSNTSSSSGELRWEYSSRTLNSLSYRGTDGWDPSGPDVPAAHCVMMDSVGGRWKSAECTLRVYSFICQQKGHVTCGSPVIRNGSHSLSNNNHLMKLSCDPGHRLVGPDTYICDTNTAVWRSNTTEYSANASYCELIVCPTQNVSDYNLVLTSHVLQSSEYLIGGVLSYSCESEYYVPDELSTGAFSARCQGDGTWNNTIKRCRRVQCDPSQILTEPGLSGTFTTYDSISFQCAAGRRITARVAVVDSDDVNITCRRDETWSRRDLGCQSCSCDTSHTLAEVCDPFTGMCLCDATRRVAGESCEKCESGYFYRANQTDPCSQCNCVASNSTSLQCDRLSGQCSCKCGCYGRTCSSCDTTCQAVTNYTVGLTARGLLNWPAAEIGETVRAKCTYGGGVATRTCDCVWNSTLGRKIPLWNPEPDISQCMTNPDPNAALNALLNVVVSEENAAEISGAMTDITADETSIEPKTLGLSGDVVVKIVDVRTSDIKVGEGLVSTFSNLGKVDIETLKNGNTASNSSNRLLVLAEQYGSTTLLDGSGKRLITSESLSVELRDVPVGRLRDSNLTATRNSQTAGSKPGPRASMSLSNVAVRNRAAQIRVQFSVFKNSTLFERDTNTSNNTGFHSNVTGKPLKVASAVVSGKLGSKGEPFDGEVGLDFELGALGVNPKCVFWDFSLNNGQGGWNSDGCRIVYDGNETTNLTAGQHVQCYCTHMTHFAVLMDLDPQQQTSPEHILALSIITYIGCSVSMIALLFAIILLLAFRRLRQQVQMKLLLHLCVAWFMALVFFIIGGRVTDHRGPCTTMAVLTHFFLLAVFAFSFAQAYYLYCSLVKIYGNLVKKFMWKCILLGWGIPALIVIITMASTVMDAYEPHEKNNNTVCILSYGRSKVAYILSFYVPIGLVLVANIVVLFLVLKRVVKPRPGMHKRDIEDVKRDLKLAVSLSLLLGLTWMFGMALVGDVKLVFQYVFTALNAFLGLFIVIMHLGLRKEARDEISKSWSRMSENSFLTSSSLLRSSKTPGSQSRSSSTGTTAKTAQTSPTTSNGRDLESTFPTSQSKSSYYVSVATSENASTVVADDASSPSAPTHKEINGCLAVAGYKPIPQDEEGADNVKKEDENTQDFILAVPPPNARQIPESDGNVKKEDENTQDFTVVVLAVPPPKARQVPESDGIDQVGVEHSGNDMESKEMTKSKTSIESRATNESNEDDTCADLPQQPQQQQTLANFDPDSLPSKLSRNVSELSTTAGRVIMFPNDDSMISQADSEA